MKKFRLLLVLLIAAASVTAAFAFTKAKAPAKKAATEVSWFLYDEQFSGGTTNPMNYVKISGEPECNGSGDLCAIQAPVDENDHPDVENILDDRGKE